MYRQILAFSDAQNGSNSASRIPTLLSQVRSNMVMLVNASFTIDICKGVSIASHIFDSITDPDNLVSFSISVKNQFQGHSSSVD